MIPLSAPPGVGPVGGDPAHPVITAPSVPLRQKIGLGLGRITSEASLGTLHNLVNPVYNMTLGLSPAAISTVMFVQRLWDAMLDPLAGHFSDNFRSRWGRRIPLAVGAALPLALLYAALWWVRPGMQAPSLFWHLLLVSLAFYLAHSVFAMAMGGLLLEATDDYHERTRVISFTFMFGFVVQIAMQWVFPLTQLLGGGSTMTSLYWVTGVCAGLFLVCGLAPALLCREPKYAERAARQPRTSLWKSLREVRSNRPFVLVLATRFIVSFGYNTVAIFFMYMNIYYVYGGDIRGSAVAQGIIGSSFHIASVLSALFLYPQLERRWGKRRALQSAAVILMLGCVAKLFVYHPGLPWLQLVVLMANGASSAGLLILMNSMLGDIADYDELRTGLRREALFVSLMNWCDKAGNSLGTLVSGVLLVAIGFEAGAGAQTPATLLWMKLCYFFCPFLAGLIVLIVIRRYDLTEEKSAEIRHELAARRSGMAASRTSTSGQV